MKEDKLNIPIREKYVDEAVGVWFIFGENRATGTADISDGDGDVFCLLPKSVAEAAVQLQEEFREKLYRLLCSN